jgi:hypothetical protein
MNKRVADAARSKGVFYFLEAFCADKDTNPWPWPDDYWDGSFRGLQEAYPYLTVCWRHKGWEVWAGFTSAGAMSSGLYQGPYEHYSSCQGGYGGNELRSMLLALYAPRRRP